jgi:four helix bundle protein
METENTKKFDFENDEIYKSTFEYAEAVYKLSKLFPKEEAFGLTAQLKTNAVKINTKYISFWSGREKEEKNKYLHKSLKYLFKCVTLLKLALSLEYIKPEKFEIFYDASLKLAEKLKQDNF